MGASVDLGTEMLGSAEAQAVGLCVAWRVAEICPL